MHLASLIAFRFAILIFGAGHPAINYLLLLAIADDALGMALDPGTVGTVELTLRDVPE